MLNHLICLATPHALQKNILKIFNKALLMLSQVEVLNREELMEFIALMQLPKMGYQYLLSLLKGSIHLILLGKDIASE